MRLLFLSALLSACTGTGDAPPRTGPTDGTLTGRVVAVDLSPMAYDGNALVTVTPDGGGADVAVHIPARQNLCAAAIENLDAVAPGDRVEVRGTPGEVGTLTPCDSADHVFRVLEQATPGREVVRGVYTTSFEVSAFTPCDRPNEAWWLTPNEAFGEALGVISNEHRSEGGRGGRLYVEATVEGTLSPEGTYGHLGSYTRELTVTGVRDMVYLATDPDEPPTCR
ncbi:hypothetical protein [Rubrivirga sp. IMCC43871]|uniref:hypothetical protein n=1 Tax=Rubrivirga sp. IMCC43871 TaxID=3391575 RepID=UPI00398FF503